MKIVVTRTSNARLPHVVSAVETPRPCASRGTATKGC